MRKALQHFSVDGRHFRMEAAFLEVQFVGDPQGRGELELRWATARNASRFFHGGHAWPRGSCRNE